MNDTMKSERGDDTRAALVAAATRVFARYGFEGASSRMLAGEAGVNLALIGYHFGGKRGLYLAVFDEIAATVGQRLMPGVARTLEEFAESEAADPAAAVAAIIRLLHAIAELFLDPDNSNWARLILREQQDPTEAFERLYDGPMGRMLQTMTHLAGIAAADEPDVDVRILALTLISEVMVFRMAYSAATRHLGWDDGIGAKEIEQIKAQVARNVNARFSEVKNHVS